MWFVARLLTPGAASRLGAATVGRVGPRLRKHRQVLTNLRQAMPHADSDELQRVARGVWRNLGSVLFEYPHLTAILASRVRVVVPEAMRTLLDSGRPMLFMTAHVGNWELAASLLGRRGDGMVVVYSPNANPGVQGMIQRFRRPGGCEYVTKQEALRRITRKFVAGRSVGLLPDVRVDSGPDLDLFGRGAPTTVSPPRLAARLDYPMVPVRVVRTGPAQFDIEFHPPLTARQGLLGKRAAIDVMAQFNELLESWISEHPDQWLCAKRRWPKAAAHNGV